MRTLTPDDAAAEMRPTDVLCLPLGPGQPPAFVEALGRRTDWVDLRIIGSLLTVLSDVFNHPNVHYLSGFYGPARAARCATPAPTSASRRPTSAAASRCMRRGATTA